MSGTGSNFQYRQYQEKLDRERNRVAAAIDTNSPHEAYVGYVQLANLEHGLASICADGEQSRHERRCERYRKAASVLARLLNDDIPGIEANSLFGSAASVARELGDDANPTESLARTLVAYHSSLPSGDEQAGAGSSQASPAATDGGGATAGDTGNATGSGSSSNDRTGPSGSGRDSHLDVDSVADDLVDFTTQVDTTFDEVGGYADVKDTLHEEVIVPLERRELAKEYDLSPSGGVMLVGPPGCGKTLLVRAMCGDAGWSFGEVDCTNATSALFGKSAKRLTAIFEQAKEQAAENPTVLFFDEIDALVPDRNQQMASNSGSSQLVTTFLTQMNDLAESNHELVVVGATNTPDTVDSAVIDNKNRFRKIIEMDLPDAEAREEIFRVHLSTRPTDDANLEYAALAEATQGFSGADIEAAVKMAAKQALNESGQSTPIPLDQERLMTAVNAIQNEAGADENYL